MTKELIGQGIGGILVTGSNGFVGRSVYSELAKRGYYVRRIVRELPRSGGRYSDLIEMGDIGPNTDWSAALANINILVHLAGRAHVMHETVADPLTAFRAVNVQGTLNLARQAAAVGVRRFVFMSSVKVNGESTIVGQPFTADDVPMPMDAYGVSKMEAEQGLHEIALRTGMEVVIIRSPLVYGPGVKANFAVMMRWVQRGVPLPLGAIHNQRSLVALDNLVDLIVTCLAHPAAANQTFMVSDGEDVSTTELLQRLGRAMGRPARLLPVPANWVQLVMALVGKRDVARRLCGSLHVEIEKTRRLLGWTPPLSLDEGLMKIAEEYVRETGI